MSTATFGTANEDNAHLSKSDSRAVRRRSLALLGSLIRPVRFRFWLTIATVVLSQAARVAGPALIAFGIDHALPALQAGDNHPLVFTGVAYLLAAIATAGLTALYVTSTARLSQAMLLDLRLRVFRQTQRLSLEFHEKYTSGRIIARQTSDLEAVNSWIPASAHWHRACCLWSSPPSQCSPLTGAAACWCLLRVSPCFSLPAGTRNTPRLCSANPG
jgi:ATP-binding cassette subfamily B protein